MAQASSNEGVQIIRAAGTSAAEVSSECRAVIGIDKTRYPGYGERITATIQTIDLLAADCASDVIAFDASLRPRPGGATTSALIEQIHRHGLLAMADCDCLESARAAAEAGADLLATTLAGYTAEPSTVGPDLELLRELVKLDKPVLAEGRFSEPWQIRAALQIGAKGVVIGGAINDPVKQTRRFVRAADRGRGDVGAVDLGGTWLRFGIFSPDWEIKESWRIERPDSPQDRIDWIARQIAAAGIHRVGVSSGGVINPATGSVVKAKSIIPGHVGTRFDRDALGATTSALNDGLATAWGHACHPRFAGMRVATLALGTGVGFGIVDRGRILMGPLGEPPHLNDLLFLDATIEAALGGGNQPQEIAFRHAVQVVRSLYHPDAIAVCGSVGLSETLSMAIHELGLHVSPFGEDAGLYGAAALALFPPEH